MDSPDEQDIPPQNLPCTVCLKTIRIENLKKKVACYDNCPGIHFNRNQKTWLSTADGQEQGESPLQEQDLMSPQYVAGLGP